MFSHIGLRTYIKNFLFFKRELKDENRNIRKKKGGGR